MIGCSVTSSRKGRDMMKLKTIVNAVDALNELQQKELPVQESFKLLNLLQQVDPHLKNYTEQRQKLLQRYGETVDGNNYTILKEKVSIYFNEMEPLENLDIELNFEKIRLSADINIKPMHLRQLLDFVELKEGE